MNRESKLKLYRVEADRLRILKSACSSLLDTIKNEVPARDVRKALDKLEKEVRSRCPVCAIVKKMGGKPDGPDEHCCPAWRRCDKFLWIQIGINNKLDTLSGILAYRRKIHPSLKDSFAVKVIRKSDKELGKLLKRTERSIKRMGG